MPVYKSVPFIHVSGAQFMVACLEDLTLASKPSGVLYASSEERLAAILHKATGSTRDLPAGFARWVDRPAASRPASPPPPRPAGPTWTAEARSAGAAHARSVRPRSVGQTRAWLVTLTGHAELTAAGLMNGNPMKRSAAVTTAAESYIAACSREGVVPDGALLRRAATAARLAAAAAAEATSPIEG
jgi:hypothetical protein